MSIKYYEWTEEQLTYPEFYKDRDRDWIGRQLSRLTFDHRKNVCEEYREVFLKQSRNDANKHLLDYCNKHGKARAEKAEPIKQADNPLQSRIDKIRNNHKHRKSILDMAEGK